MCSYVHKEQGFTDFLAPDLQGVQTMKVLDRKLEPWPRVSPTRPGNRLYSLTVEPSYFVDSRSANENPSVRTSSYSNSLRDGAFFPHPPIRLYPPPLPGSLPPSLPPSVSPSLQPYSECGTLKNQVFRDMQGWCLQHMVLLCLYSMESGCWGRSEM